MRPRRSHPLTVGVQGITARGFGTHRSSLPWVSVNHLHGITGCRSSIPRYTKGSQTETDSRRKREKKRDGGLLYEAWRPRTTRITCGELVRSEQGSEMFKH